MSRVTESRRGAALAELIVALALSTLVAAAAAAVLAGAERYVRRTETASQDRRAVREAGLALAAELSAVPADSLRLMGDTAVEFLGLVGTSVACVVTAGELVLPPSTASSAVPYTVWRAAPGPGDLIVALDSTTPARWRAVLLDSVETRTDGAGCTPASGLRPAGDSAARYPVSRLFLSAALPAGVPVGAPVRVLRWGRYVLTRGADRTWSLSYRACGVARVCGPSQPVAGPLGAASDTGLAFLLNAGAGRLEVTLRAPPRGRGTGREIRRFSLTMRNRATGAP